MTDVNNLRCVVRDGSPVMKGKCPGCEHWLDLDDDQLNGVVSTFHDDPQCGFHETFNWWERFPEGEAE